MRWPVNLALRVANTPEPPLKKNAARGFARLTIVDLVVVFVVVVGGIFFCPFYFFPPSFGT